MTSDTSSNSSTHLPGCLATAHAWTRRQAWLGRFTLMNRLLLAMAFLPTGLVKASGQRFTLLGTDNPIGYFFEAMYRTGPYWYFLGWMQIIAAVMLLIPATATLGALVFAPISLSIFLITFGVGFGNTTIITGAMLLASIYLICWDGDRVWAAGSKLFSRRTGPGLLANMNVLEASGWILGGLTGMGFFLAARSFLPNSSIPILFWIGLGAIATVLLGWLVAALPRTNNPV
ncbi:MAG: hypothetical protein ACYTG5_23170 [Planctomycetota bacterium]|jgi:hypothetical protein